MPELVIYSGMKVVRYKISWNPNRAVEVGGICYSTRGPVATLPRAPTKVTNVNLDMTQMVRYTVTTTSDNDV